MKQLPSLTKFGITLLIAAGTSLGSLTASADTGTTWFGEPAIGQWMAGIKIGNTEVDIPGYDKGSNAALMLGYQFARPIGAPADNQASNLNWARVVMPILILVATVGFVVIGIATPSPHILPIALPEPFTSKASLAHFTPALILISTSFAQMQKAPKPTLPTGLGLGYQIPGSETVQIEAEWVNSSGDHDLNMLTLGINFLF